VEGAVLAIDNRTGQIKAMIGGYSFERSKFNRATQAYRQVALPSSHSSIRRRSTGATRPCRSSWTAP